MNIQKPQKILFEINNIGEEWGKMKLDKENTKQILKIVIIAIIVLVALLNIGPVWNVVKLALSILSPFIWGLAIAFILNIFMTLYENKLFKLGQNKKVSKVKNEYKSPNYSKHIQVDTKKVGK